MGTGNSHFLSARDKILRGYGRRTVLIDVFVVLLFRLSNIREVSLSAVIMMQRRLLLSHSRRSNAIIACVFFIKI